MSKKKKVVLINYTLNFGGTERYISEIANFLSKKDIEVYIILLDNSTVEYDLEKEITVVQPTKKRPEGTWKKIFYFLYIFRYVKCNVRKLNPAIIINTAFPAFIMAAIGNSFPIVLSIRCDPQKTGLIEGFKIPKILRKYFYKRAKIIIAQTQYAKEILFKQFGHNNIITIPNFLTEYKDLEIEKLNEIVCVGRLVKSKGQDYLIRAFSMIEHKYWKLILVGDGPEKSNLEQLTHSLGLSDRVSFVGNQKEVNFYYQRAKIFAFPSLTEGFPNVLLEAMASNLACISFNCISGPSEIINDGKNGFLVEVGNVRELSEKLNLLINDDAFRFSLCEQAIYVRHKYNIENIGKQYLNIISKF
jgi:GalNAc-alpha-(1->4)-GalNAc-alpha-(1->3)-diNAcBac-PP-undecaprenol alpha-1,4-N-acetyl-D-galactosaminyltransferase